MIKVALLVWIMLGTVLAGVGVVSVLMTPGLMAQGMKFIPISALAGFALAIPLSLLIAKQLVKTTA